MRRRALAVLIRFSAYGWRPLTWVSRFVRRPPPGTRTPPELESLTPRELEVFRHIACGRSNAEIAQLLYVTDETVKTHASRIFMKLDVRDRTQAVILAYEQGIVEPAARSGP